MNKPDLDDARNKANEVQDSTAYRWLVSGGLVAFGVVHLLIAYLAVRLALGSSEEASQTGALRELAKAPLGPLLLWATSAGLFTIAIWQLLNAFVGHRHLSGKHRLRRRISSAGRTVVYGVLGWNAASIALGGGGGGDGAKTASATLMSAPFGLILVGLVGVAIGAVGVSQIMKGVRDKYEDELQGALNTGQQWIARVGHVGKGASIMIVGALFLWAAWTHDSNSAGGLDTALQTVRSAPYGIVVLGAIALGFACYGAYCFIWAKHARFH